MSCDAFKQFPHVANIGNSLLMNELESNMKLYMDWSLLKIGAYYNITLPTSGYYGGDFSVLRPFTDQYYSSGTVWQGIRKDWVWETGVCRPAEEQPIQISGVYVNGTLTTSGYHINYPMGRVVFDSPVTGTVRVEHSFRWVQTLIADNAPWWKEIQYQSFRPDESQWSALGSGVWSIGAEHRIQLPAIIIEAVPRRRARGRELGHNALRVQQDVLCHILTEDRWSRNQLIDILANSYNATIQLINTSTVRASGAFPLNEKGSVANTGSNYSYLVDNFPYTPCWFADISTSEIETLHPQLHAGSVRMTCEVIISSSG